LGYALRHVDDLVGAFHEFRRILKRGGTVMLLEVSGPSKRVNRVLVSVYLGRMVPLLSPAARPKPRRRCALIAR
jgi:demethylmenaquinone methyltransferase / 2-methoxy-6-polyprenyl-1,4-benzoquinol methylase